MAVESMSVEQRRRAIAKTLFDWYHRNARILPWRIPPKAGHRADAYRVWLSEVMLQQTTVAAVRPYFQRFTARWPTLPDLAAADPADILAAWAGLGYYSRARNLIACAQAVMKRHGGIFPREETALRALPGVGDYTAAAIAAIAFGAANAVPVDANIERVIARLFAIDDPLPNGRTAIRNAARALWPDDNGGDFAQALMDLGATICTARAPDCPRCPLRELCRAKQNGIAGIIPVKAAKKPKPHRHGRVSWIERNGAVWLVRRPDKGMLAGMRALPGESWSDSNTPPPKGVHFIGTVRHVFTHFSLDLAVDRPQDGSLAVGEGEWWPIDRLDEAGLPTLYRRAAEIALAGE
jgi:A/G-specific adenine glycosylase